MSDVPFAAQVVEWFADAGRWSGTTGIPNRLGEHVLMSLLAVAIATAVALPAGLLIGHARRFELVVVSVANVGRAVPSFGLLFLFVLWLGLGLRYPAWGRPPVVLALVLLAIPPILTNTYVGVQGVDRATVEAARGMGMGERRLLLGVELPLALPLILAGLRTASVQVVATASLAAVVAGGGLGRFIIDGFALGESGRPQVFAGALLVALLALLTEGAFALTERVVGRARATRRASGPLPPPLGA